MSSPNRFFANYGMESHSRSSRIAVHLNTYILKPPIRKLELDTYNIERSRHYTMYINIIQIICTDAHDSSTKQFQAKPLLINVQCKRNITTSRHDTLTQQFFNVFNALCLLFFITHHSQRGCTVAIRQIFCSLLGIQRNALLLGALRVQREGLC